MNYSKQSSNVNRSVTQSRDVVKTHVVFIFRSGGIKYNQNVVVFILFSFVAERSIKV